MPRTIESFTTTAGQTVEKKMDSSGRVYYVAEGEGQISVQAYAGKARHKKPEPKPTRDPLAPDPTSFKKEDKTEAITTSTFEVYDEFRVEDGGVPISSYPIDQRVRNLRNVMREQRDYEYYTWSMRYKVVRDGVEEPEFSRMRTKMMAYDLGSLEENFRKIHRNLLALAADYSNVHVYSTNMVGRIEA